MPRPNERALVRPHVVTGGRAHPTRNVFDLVTLVVAVGEPAGLTPEKRRIVTLCRGGALSVVEIAGHLHLPVGVTRVLLSDLMDSGHVTTGFSRTEILQEVLDGLRARL
jgi:hypothetical protein